MKRLKKVSFMIVATILSGCIKTHDVPTAEKPLEKEITFTIGTKTRVGHLFEDEKNIDDVHIYIFNMETNALEAILGGKYNASIPQYTTKLVHGYKRIITLANMANYPQTAQIAHPEDLLDKYQLNLNKLISEGKFPLFDDISINFTPYNKDFTIILKNATARICIRKITNSIVKDRPIKLLNAYISNIPGTRLIDSTKAHTSTIWYNKYGRTAATPHMPIESELLSDIGKYGFISLKADINKGSSFSPTSMLRMYTFPCTRGTSMTNSTITKLVITTEIEGKKYYYPINLAGLKSCYSYNVALTITKLGSDDPDSENFFSSHDVSITMEEWTHLPNSNVDIEF